MKFLVLTFSLFFCQSIKCVAQSPYVDSFLKSPFTVLLLQNHRLEEVNLHWKNTLKKVQSPKKNILYTIQWARYSCQPSFSRQYSLLQITSTSFSELEKRELIEDFVSIHRHSFAYYIAQKWHLNKLLPALALLSNKDQNYRDSFTQIDPVVDSLYNTYKRRLPKAALAYSLSVLPGMGKMYLGNGFDAWGSLFAIGTFTAQAIDNKGGSILQYAYITTASMFYFGSIYGTAMLLNKNRKEQKHMLHEAIIGHLIPS